MLTYVAQVHRLNLNKLPPTLFQLIRDKEHPVIGPLKIICLPRLPADKIQKRNTWITETPTSDSRYVLIKPRNRIKADESALIYSDDPVVGEF